MHISDIKSLLEGFDKISKAETNTNIGHFDDDFSGFSKTQEASTKNINVKEISINTIKILLGEFIELQARDLKSSLESFSELLQGFSSLEKQSTNSLISSANMILEDFSTIRKQHLENQRGIADEINVFEILDFQEDEVRHSQFLAWFLNPEETHAQGNLFFREFLRIAGLPSDYLSKPYYVQTEVAHDESRIDIEIVSRGNYIIHIENKVLAIEGEAQLLRETNDMEKARQVYRIDQLNSHALFLTPDGRLPDEHGAFKPISWRMIGDALKGFIINAQAERAKWVAEQYLKVVESISWEEEEL